MPGPKDKPKARRVIQVVLNGGMSQLDDGAKITGAERAMPADRTTSRPYTAGDFGVFRRGGFQ